MNGRAPAILTREALRKREARAREKGSPLARADSPAEPGLPCVPTDKQLLMRLVPFGPMVLVLNLVLMLFTTADLAPVLTKILLMMSCHIDPRRLSLVIAALLRLA